MFEGPFDVSYCLQASVALSSSPDYPVLCRRCLHQQVHHSDSQHRDCQKFFYSKNIITNSEKNCQQEDAQDYILPLVIQTVKLIVILFMTFLLRKIQIQVLYFLSLIFTVILLLLLGLICEPSLSSSFFNPSTTKYIKTAFLCLHVTFIQLGLQSLPGLIMDVLYPNAYKASPKGFSISIGSVLLIVLILILKSFPYSYSFWIMGALILISLPFLYIFLPEIRNIGTDICAEFFLPFQTIFHISLPEVKRGPPNTRLNAVKCCKEDQYTECVSNI